MNLLVIAPHQDDEILSAFLLMHNVLEKNGTVNILYATNGDYRGIDYAYTRYYESLNALSLLGICEDHMLYLGYADTGMSKEKSFLMRLRSTPEQQNSPVSSCTYHPANKETVHSLHTETQAEYTSQNFLDDLVYATLRKNLCKFKNCDKSDILERLKNNRSDFFTVYNGYCNLSRFFGYQPAGMERSGMGSG